MSSVPREKWWKIQWYSKDDTPEERKFIVKLDALLVPYLLVAYWVKHLDQANLSNAYVAGMKEDLGFHGNELVQLQSMYSIGVVFGQIPFVFLFTYIPMYWTIPFMDVMWGVFTLLQYRATSFGQMAAYRFFAAFFPAVHFVLGSWYRGHEINRRGGVFYTGYGLGSMTSSLLASAATSNLHGVYGLAGWRWLYIICFVITIPVGIIGFFVLPGTVAQPNRWFLSKEEVEVARRRLERDGHKTSGKLKVHHIRRTLTSPRFWAVAFIDILWKNAGLYKTQGSYLLWIKSLGRYSASKVNQLGSIAPGLGIFWALLACFASDLLIGPVWAICFSSLWNSVCCLILTIWNVPEGALWFAFTTSFWANAMSTVFHGWVNNLLRDSPEERSFTLVLINTIAEATTAVIPLGVFKTIESPTFPKGYPFCFGCAVSVIVVTLALAWYEKRNQRLLVQRDDVEDSGLENDGSISASPNEQGLTVQSSSNWKN
ncbi:hypothetical protein CDV36_013656 [Fusarium kuroshium]|uniref:Major facilitator superfamily (MFS) profile domain-containing protein n=2 Tax=Fusarium solani species complex TaxID=232080 RepID=A0A3M2RN52_9HYPO|nr:hypothetical protein CDV36_013656 [Fusarium kuroshium]